jgi:hypothetical protein
MKTQKGQLSELFISGGVPFHRDMFSGNPRAAVEINLFQIMSRILHAHRTEVMCKVYQIIMYIPMPRDDKLTLVAAHKSDLNRYIEPIVFVGTKQEPTNFFRLARLLELARLYLIEAVSMLEQKDIHVSKTYHDI